MESVLTRNSVRIIARFRSVRSQTLKLVEPLIAEDFVVQPIEDVSPPKWHLAHSTWFFENFLLKVFKKDYKVFHPAYSYIFNSYYESVGERVHRFKRGELTRPSVADVLSYRKYVDSQMEELIQSVSEEDASFYKFLEIGLQHEQQHQELLLTDIKYILGNNPLFPLYRKSEIMISEPNVPEAAFLEVEGGLHEIGYKGDEFAWDNEKPPHTVYLNDFRIMNRLVTNREYLEFMHDGGYTDFRFWLSEGWGWVQNEKWIAPLYWQKVDNEWHNFTLGGLRKVALNEPVTHISFYEADAYAAWADKRLLTEFEWEVATAAFRPALKNANFVENALYHPATLQEGERCAQLLGDCWEWTYSSYHPYPGYKREEGALGEYNGKFMLNQMVLRGGSCATPMDHIRTTYRNFFHPDKRWQFSGIRLAENS